MNPETPQQSHRAKDWNAANPRVALPSCATVEQVYIEHALLLRRVAIKKFDIPPGDADTLVHDVFAAYIANQSAVRSNLRSYLVAAISNASRNYWRSHSIDAPKRKQEKGSRRARDVKRERAQQIKRGDHLPTALQEFARRVESEDAEAHRLLDAVIHSPYRFASAKLVERRHFRTGGVVRLLCEAAREECDRQPLYALEIADMARMIAESLPNGDYPSALVCELRGRAWKEYATACQCVGNYKSGFDALRNAERAYRRLPHSDTALAGVSLSMAILLWDLRRYSDALPYAQAAAKHYSALRDVHRYIEAQEVMAVVLERMGDHAQARSIYKKAFKAADVVDDPGMKARAARNLGISYRDAHDLENASKYLVIAVDLYNALCMPALLARTKWSLARLSLEAGKYVEAELRLRGAIEALEGNGLWTDAAEATMDLVTVLGKLGREEDAASLAQDLAKEASSGHITRRLPKALNPRADFIIGHYLRECFRSRMVARVSELAERLRANRATLSRTMARTLGRPLLAELRKRQLDEAARLLRKTDFPVAGIACRSAFGDRSTFFRVFRAAFGMTPSEYRKATRTRQQNTTLRR